MHGGLPGRAGRSKGRRKGDAHLPVLASSTTIFLLVGLFYDHWYLTTAFQVLMVIHWVRNRPEFYWLWIIILLGPLGSAIYLFVEVLPGMRWKLPAIERLERRRRRQYLERVVTDSPTQESLAQLARICAIEGEHKRAAELYGEAIRRDPHDPESLFGRGKALLELGSPSDAIPDLRAAVEQEPAHAFYQAAVTLAEAYEASGDDQLAEQTYQSILGRTTVSAAYYGYARLLAKRGETAQARAQLKQILDKQPGLPRYLRRQERPWVRKASAMLKELG